MQEFLNEARRHRFKIEEELSSSNATTARQMAERFGYEHLGDAKIERPPYPSAIFVGRQGVTYNPRSVGEAVDKLREEGYDFYSVNIDLHDRYFSLMMIMGKEYKGGGTALLERRGSLKRNPVIIAGHSNGYSVLGVFLDTPPEHYGDARHVAELFGMEPRAQEQLDAPKIMPGAPATTKIPDAFLKAFEELN